MLKCSKSIFKNKTENPGGARTLPLWTLKNMAAEQLSEKPLGEEDVGPYIVSVYTPEQQQRLGVNKLGEPVAAAATIEGATELTSDELISAGPATAADDPNLVKQPVATHKPEHLLAVEEISNRVDYLTAQVPTWRSIKEVYVRNGASEADSELDMPREIICDQSSKNSALCFPYRHFSLDTFIIFWPKRSIHHPVQCLLSDMDRATEFKQHEKDVRYDPSLAMTGAL